MIIISAMTEDRVIGSGDGMPWNVPAEYQQYLNFVNGQTVILGRKSYEIFGPDLPPGTTPIAVSRSAMIEGVEVRGSLPAAIAYAESLGKQIYVAGGSSIYEQAIPLADAMYLSTIKGDFTGDSYFPKFDPSEWHVVEERDQPGFIFRKYSRIDV